MNLYTLFEYSARYRARLTDSLKSIPPDAFTREHTAIGHGSLRETLLHCVGVEDEWVTVDAQKREMEWDQYLPERYPTPNSIFEKWDEVRQRTLDFAAALGPIGLEEKVEITDGVVSRGWFSIEDILIHVLLHEIGHRGDVTTLMSAIGVPVPGFDHISLLRWQRNGG